MGGEAELAAVEVRAGTENLVGIAVAASEGEVSRARIANQPLLRPADLLEMVPGLVVGQHSGEGKANQYFLRGFNLDHGTDFRTTVAGVPVNLPSHAHGQGYTDLNFLIPELVASMRFRKGPYYTDEGDFSSAGAVHVDYLRRIDGTLAQVGLGSGRHARSLLAGSPQLGSGRLLYALEWSHSDGPWVVPENFRKENAVLRYSEGTLLDGFSVTAMAYRGNWTASDQLPQRAVAAGTLDPYGSLDPASGGQTRRLSLSADWSQRVADGRRKANVWLLDSSLSLYSNFTYCLNDIATTGTCASGDQFLQSERRRAGGFAASTSHIGERAGVEYENSIGVEMRSDRIHPGGLYATSGRELSSTVREDNIRQQSLAVHAQSEQRWLPFLRTTFGLRADLYRFAVDSDLALNSGRAADQLLSPKFGLVLGPWRGGELYFNLGSGFHSNDARGTTQRVDPASGEALKRVTPLVKTRGAELGLRTRVAQGWQGSIAVWRLEVDSELVFVGDAGTTEPSRASRRQGVELSSRLSLRHGLSLDTDLAWSRARFTGGEEGEGFWVRGAAPFVASLGLTAEGRGPWSAALRLRHLAARPLIEDNSVRSAASTLLNLRVSRQLAPKAQVTLDIFNLLDRRVSDVEYWYVSQLPGEAAPVADRHAHPAHPRSARLALAYRF